jgi:RNA polymerase sigma-70 factor (ECF subfamily)
MQSLTAAPPMHTTPISLLERVRQPGEQAAWARLVEMYTPLLFYWARRRGLQESDAADLVQDVFALLVHKLPEFVYDRRKSFRNWLRTILYNKDRDRVRRAAHQPRTLGPLTEPSVPGDAEAAWEAEYRELLVARALELMQNEFQPATWKACWEVVVAGRPAAEVAAELGLTVGAVYAAKSRVLRRLRRELDGLLE